MSTEAKVAEKKAASELGERRWAVLSERGGEATRLDYAAATGLVRRLKGEGVRGLCVVTEAAAARLPPARPAAPGTPAGNGAKRPPRAPKK